MGYSKMKLTICGTFERGPLKLKEEPEATASFASSTTGYGNPRLCSVSSAYLVIEQRGPTTGLDRSCAACGTILHNSSLVDHKQRQPSITRHGELMGQSLALRPIPSEGFFVYREHHDFGTKIEKSEIDSK